MLKIFKKLSVIFEILCNFTQNLAHLWRHLILCLKSMSKSSKKNSKSVKEKIKKAPGRTITSVLTGGVIHSDFFYRHKIKIFVMMILIMFYISTKYECQTGMENIRKLEKELDVVRTEAIREKATYMSRIRESSMTALADSLRPGLVVQQHPPFVLDKYKLTKFENQ